MEKTTETEYVYYSALMDELFTLLQAPPKGATSNDELILCVDDLGFTLPNIYYVGKL